MNKNLVHVRYRLDGLLIKIYIKVPHYTLYKALVCINKTSFSILTSVFILMNLKLAKHSYFYIHAAMKE